MAHLFPVPFSVSGPFLVAGTSALLLSLGGCKKTDDTGQEDRRERHHDTGDLDTGPSDTGDPQDTADTGDSGDTGLPADDAAWSLLVFMNGDNDLEDWVIDDLNELEVAGSTEEIHVLVQADRAEGYSRADGNWTDARRYYIHLDENPHEVTSEVVEELGEVDMGDPAVLSDFLVWAHQEYPAERMILSMWNHGDGWSLRAAGGEQPAPPYISDDEESGNWMSIADGDLREGLEEIVDLRGPLDIIAFDACNMASWEVAHSLRDQADYFTASEATVGMEGYTYDLFLEYLQADPEATTADVAVELARGAVEEGREETHSATDLAHMDTVAEAVDRLAGAVLDDSSLEQPLLQAREQARGTDYTWEDYYLDLDDFASVLSDSEHQELADAGVAIGDALDQAVLASFTRNRYGFAGGLNHFFDTSLPSYVMAYNSGEGATWAEATRWDDLMMKLAGLQ